MKNSSRRFLLVFVFLLAILFTSIIGVDVLASPGVNSQTEGGLTVFNGSIVGDDEMGEFNADLLERGGSCTYYFCIYEF